MLSSSACDLQSNIYIKSTANPDKKEELFEEKSGDSNNLKLAETIELEIIGIDEGFIGWDSPVLQYGEYLYYVTKQGLMKWDEENGSELVLDEANIGGIVIDEPWLYYYNSKSMEISRVKLNEESSPERVFDTDMINESETLDQMCGFTVYNGKLYIKDTTISCFSYDIITGHLKIFNNDMSSGVFLNGKFYYIEHSQRSFSIYRTDLNSGLTELVRGDGVPYNPDKPNKDIMYDKLIVVEVKLFYSTRVNPAIYQYNEEEEDLLIEDFSSLDIIFLQMTIDGQYLYYTYDNSDIIHRYIPNENSVTLIKTPEEFKKRKDFMIVNNVLYYTLGDGGIISYSMDQMDLFSEW